MILAFFIGNSLSRESKINWLNRFSNLQLDLKQLELELESVSILTAQKLSFAPTERSNISINDKILMRREKINERINSKLNEIEIVRNEIIEKLEQLRFKEGYVLRLRYINLLTVFEIAEILDCSVTTVYRFHKNGLENLEIE